MGPGPAGFQIPNSKRRTDGRAAPLEDKADDERPSEQLVKCAKAREVVIDDFNTTERKICNETLRSYTGGNPIAAAGKFEKEQTLPVGVTGVPSKPRIAGSCVCVLHTP